MKRRPLILVWRGNNKYFFIFSVVLYFVVKTGRAKIILTKYDPVPE